MRTSPGKITVSSGGAKITPSLDLMPMILVVPDGSKRPPFKRLKPATLLDLNRRSEKGGIGVCMEMAICIELAVVIGIKK